MAATCGRPVTPSAPLSAFLFASAPLLTREDWKRVGLGKRGDLGGRRIIKKKKRRRLLRLGRQARHEDERLGSSRRGTSERGLARRAPGDDGCRCGVRPSTKRHTPTSECRS